LAQVACRPIQTSASIASMESGSNLEILLDQCGGGHSSGADAAAPLTGKIIYALVAAAQHRILVQHAFVDGCGCQLGNNIGPVTISHLKYFDSTVVGTFKTYVLGDHCWHYTIDASAGKWYVCWAARGMGRRVPSIFLEEMQEVCEARQDAPAQLQRPGLQRTQEEFDIEIQALMEKFNDRSIDSVNRLEAKSKHARVHSDDVMESLEWLSERGENVEVLVQMAERCSPPGSLSCSQPCSPPRSPPNLSTLVRPTAREVRNRGWWQERKAIACFILVVLCAILLIAFGVPG